MLRIIPITWLLCLSAPLCIAQDAPGQDAPDSPPATAAPLRPIKVPQVKLSTFRLANGLRVVLAPDRSVPIVSISVTYDVGSRNERPGRSGFAHLFEHLMFQGSENVGRGEHFVLINDNGGTFNGTTNQDRTNFFETLPANQLDLGLFLEADRMRALDVNQENLDNQRLVVQEERRQRYDNQPFSGFQDAVLELAHSNFAYQHTTIGSMADLNAANLADVKAFYATYYSPNNAALAIVGDFDPRTVRARIEKYFGSVPRRPDPPALDLSEPEPQNVPRKTVEDNLARSSRLAMAFPTVSGGDPDYPALRLLGSILNQGRTSRLREAVVTPKLAQSAMGNVSESRGKALFTFNANLTPTSDPAKVEAAILGAIEKIKKEGPTVAELQRAKTSARIQAINSQQSAQNRANTLSEYVIFYNDPARINTFLPRLEAVTAEDIKRVATKYLVESKRLVVLGKPARSAADDPEFPFSASPANPFTNPLASPLASPLADPLSQAVYDLSSLEGSR